MTACSSVVSCPAGMVRWRPAQATKAGSSPSWSTAAPRSNVGPASTAPATRSNTASRGSAAAVAPRSASRRASAVAWPSAVCKDRDAAVTRCSRIAAQQLGRRETHEAAGDYNVSLPLHLSVLTPDAVRAALTRDSRLLVPVGTCEQHGPHLPLGCDTIIVERLADDLSASFGILRAPPISYGVNTATKRPYPGNAAVRRKTLHRWMNDLLGSWEQC